ncbi:hypothetical protein B0H19DRAFT_1142058 [Mycena capillaripes]|nr:hypothetical protein B0H19DRAFT_1142058 [Mycena capillaripes]
MGCRSSPPRRRGGWASVGSGAVAGRAHRRDDRGWEGKHAARPARCAHVPGMGSAHSHSAAASSASSGHMPASLSGVGGGGSAMTPGLWEAETPELCEFWKAYLRTPLTGPSGADVLGLQTPSASTAAMGEMLGATLTRESVAAEGENGDGNGKRYRVAILLSVETSEGEMDVACILCPFAPRRQSVRGDSVQKCHR